MKSRFPVMVGALLAAALTGQAVAQTSAPAGGDNAVIQQLLKRIDELEAGQKGMREQLAKMNAAAEAGAAMAKASAARSVAPVAEPAQAAEPAVEEAPATAARTLGPVQFRGFSNLDYGRAWFEKIPPGGLKGTPNSFSVGDFDLFVNTQISDHFSVLAEMLVTSDFSNAFSVEMDRLMLTYKHSDRFKISFGKFNTALGYYTNEFHRAQYFQTAIGRPIMYSDEDNGGLLPVHSVGVTATGAFPGSLGVHWVAEASNGRSSLFPDAPIQNFKDDGNGKAVNLAMYLRPEKVHGLQAGFSWYQNMLHPEGLATVNQTIYTAHAVYEGDRLEWLNEAALLRHSIHNGRVFHDLTAYTQLAYKLGKYRPYFRYDQQNVPSGDPIFASRERFSGPSFGVSRRLSNYVVLKVQYGRLGERIIKPTNVLQMQMAFAF